MFKISLSAANLVAKTTLVARPDPSHTTWSKLEPMATNDDVTESLQARIADPLWMLARQWQFNELQGEDAGSPIGVALKVTGLPVTTLRHPGGAVPDIALPAPFAPVEALVEHEQVLPVHPKLNAQAGQQLMRMLRAASLGGTSAALVDHYPAPLAAPDDPVADNAGFVWNALLDHRAVDALAFAGDVKALAGSRPALETFSATVGVGAAQTTAWCDLVERWLVWLADLALDGTAPGASPYWKPQRLEYAFALGAQGVGAPVRLRRRRVHRWPPRLAHLHARRRAERAAGPVGELRRRAEAPALADDRPLHRHAGRPLLGVRGRPGQLRHGRRRQERPRPPGGARVRTRLRQRLVRAAADPADQRALPRLDLHRARQLRHRPADPAGRLEPVRDEPRRRRAGGERSTTRSTSAPRSTPSKGRRSST